MANMEKMRIMTKKVRAAAYGFLVGGKWFMRRNGGAERFRGPIFDAGDA